MNDELMEWLLANQPLLAERLRYERRDAARGWKVATDAEAQLAIRERTSQFHKSNHLAAEKQLEAVRDPAERIKQWCEAYPLDIFPEPDLKLAHKTLKSVGLTLDAVSACSARHVLKGITGYIDRIEAAIGEVSDGHS